MPPVDRKNPKRAKSSDSTCSVMEFMRDFPDDDACLEFLWRERYSPDGKHADCPKCEREGVEFKKYATKQRRQSWTCTACGHHVQPTAGTAFEGSSTSLHIWFYVSYLMTSTRCGVSAKQIERETGVTYKTAWRMMNRIRNELMNEDDDREQLSGEVEADETSWGGRPRRPFKTRSESAQFREANATVLGMVERGGKLRARVVPSRRGEGFSREVRRHINPDSILYTDDWVAYKPLGREYDHRVINHSAGIYVDGEGHTNTIEGFFGNMKTGMRGAYKKVSRRWLQSYVDEYAWRYNHRDSPLGIYRELLLRAARS